MKILHLIAILAIILSVACKSNKEIISNTKNNEVVTPISVNIPEVIEDNKQLNISISTPLKEGIILFDPMLVRIEKDVETSWEKVRIVHCPCGAHCEPPKKWIQLSPDEHWNMKWNLKESWCKNNTKGEIPETIEKKADPGRYRVVIFYGYNTQNRIKLTKEFKIINY